MGWLLLAISIVLTAASCRAGMRLLVREEMDRFWVHVLIVPGQLGAAAMLTSAFGAFAPVPFLVAQGVIAGVLWAVWFRFGARGDRPARVTAPTPTDPGSVVMWIMLGALIIASVVHTCLLPMFGVDERMYHASRAMYWIQNRSIFFYETHNDRQVSFPFGAELFFAWPVLFVREELAGRLFHWVAVPVASAGVATVCRALGLSRRLSLAGALVYAATPTILFLSSGLKSDIWQPVYLLGMAYYILRSRPAGWSTWMACASAGAMFALAMNVKMTAIAVAPGMLLAALNARQVREILRRIVAMAGGWFASACVCGLALMIVSNLAHFGRPLGPQWIAAAVSPDFSARQVYIHAARTVVFLLELPELPSEGLRQIVEKRGNDLAHLLRADKPLALEVDNVWPGAFRYTMQHNATRYSLWGILWIPVLAIGCLGAARELLRSRLSLSPPAILLALHVPLFLGVVFLIRWMGDGASRFWVGPFAMAIPSGVWLVNRWTARSHIAAGAWFFLLIMTSLATLRGNIARLDWHVLHPFSPQHLDDRIHEVIPQIPPGSSILLVASEGTREYALFGPGHHYTNQVHPWGTSAFDPARARSLIERHRVTHIVIENDTRLNLWTGAVDTRPMVEWLKQQPEFRETPLKVPNVRLFARAAEPPA